VFLEIGRILRLSQFLKSECPNRQFRGDAKNKLPVWAYMKETIRKKKGLAGRKTSCGWFLSLRRAAKTN